mgnify:CR=1 FL=1
MFNLNKQLLILCIILISNISFSKEWKIAPGINAQDEIQTALILAEPGDKIILASGRYNLLHGLSLDVDNVILEGEGMDKSLLVFDEQKTGAQGLLVTSDNVTLKNFAVINAKGDAIKSKGADRISFLKKFKLYRLFWFFLYPIFWESSVLWSIFSYKRAKKTIFENNIKLVYTTSGPFSSMILGFLLKRNLKIKWVADLRDPLTESYFWDFPSKIHWYLCRLFERYIFKKPDSLIVNTEEVKKLYLKRKLVAENKITVINNGF